MKNITTIFFLVTLLLACGHKAKYSYKVTDFRPELKKHIENIALVGELPYISDTLARNFLRDSCTKDELVKLLSCENPLVRIVAYRTLVNRNEPEYFSILLNHLDDTTKVLWWYWDDAGDYFMISDLMIRKVVQERKLSQPQKDSLVDEVLTKHSYLGSAEWIMNEIQPKDKYYLIIKTAAQKKLSRCDKLSNIYALAKFRKREDIPLIRKNFIEYSDGPYCNNLVFKAIGVFPDTSFFPMLTKYFNEVIKKKKQYGFDDLKYYCLAVAQYKNRSSLDILTSLAKKETYPDSLYFSFNQEHIFRAIHQYSSPLYDSLYNVLKPQMRVYVMKYLDDPDYYNKTTW